MGRVDFRETKEKLATIENAKSEKRKEMKKLYDMLTENPELLDILMLQIGKDIEGNFPGVKFRLISRIKTLKSFTDKLENDLSGLSDKRKIDDVKIYDIIALSIIVEHVPHNIKKTNDESFDVHLLELIDNREKEEQSLATYKKQLLESKNKIVECEQIRHRKETLKKQNSKKIRELQGMANSVPEIKNIVEYLKEITEEILRDISDMDLQIQHLKNEISHMEGIIRDAKIIYAQYDNECNHAVADYIVSNLSKFDNVRALGLAEIPKRLKQKENYDGYRAVHNCYESRITGKNKDGVQEDLDFICEIQGKSIDAFYVGDRGKAARYHTNPKEEPGKIVKKKKLPNILEVVTPEQIEEFREKIRTTVPKFRVYRHVRRRDGTYVGDADIYQLSTKENFMYYYYNQLVGNEKLGIRPELDKLDDLVKSNKLSDTDGRVYKNYSYMELDER